MTKSELCPSTFPKPWVGFSKSLGGPLTLGGIFHKPGWNFPQPWVELSAPPSLETLTFISPRYTYSLETFTFISARYAIPLETCQAKLMRSVVVMLRTESSSHIIKVCWKLIVFLSGTYRYDRQGGGTVVAVVELRRLIMTFINFLLWFLLWFGALKGDKQNLRSSNQYSIKSFDITKQ